MVGCDEAGKQVQKLVYGKTERRVPKLNNLKRRRREDLWHFFSGGPCWIRTNDQAIMSRLLSPLS